MNIFAYDLWIFDELSRSPSHVVRLWNLIVSYAICCLDIIFLIWGYIILLFWQSISWKWTRIIPCAFWCLGSPYSCSVRLGACAARCFLMQQERKKTHVPSRENYSIDYVCCRYGVNDSVIFEIACVNVGSCIEFYVILILIYYWTDLDRIQFNWWLVVISSSVERRRSKQYLPIADVAENTRC